MADRKRAIFGPVKDEDAELVSGFEGVARFVDRLPGDDPTGSVLPGIDGPGEQLAIALFDRVGSAVDPGFEAVAGDAVGDQATVILKRGRRHDPEVVAGGELATAVFRPGDVDAVGDVDIRWSLAAAGVGQLAIKLQGPVVPKRGRLIQDPGSLGLLVERSLVVEIDLEASLVPAVGSRDAGEVGQDGDVGFGVDGSVAEGRSISLWL